MASFIAKQMVGNQLKSVKGAIGGGDKDESAEKKEGEEGAEGEEGEDPEITAARREAEEKRAEKHRQMEEERETMRQTIRDKYGIKKKEVEKPIEDLMDVGSMTRKKKTPAEMAAEMNPDEDEDESNMFPKNLDEFKTKVTELPGTVMTSMSEATQKCVLQ